MIKEKQCLKKLVAVFGCFWLDNVVSVLIAIFIAQSALALLQLTWKQWHQPTSSSHLMLTEIGRTSLAEVIAER